MAVLTSLPRLRCWVAFAPGRGLTARDGRPAAPTTGSLVSTQAVHAACTLNLMRFAAEP